MNDYKIKIQTSKQAGGNANDKKVPVTFAYEGQLDFSIEGECTMEMTEQELELFKQLTQGKGTWHPGCDPQSSPKSRSPSRGTPRFSGTPSSEPFLPS